MTTMSEEAADITLTVNGERVTKTVPVRRHLVDFLRLDMELTGSHLACEHGVCGACTVRVDGVAVRGCLMLAVQADGTDVVTIEGLSDSGEVADLRERRRERVLGADDDRDLTCEHGLLHERIERLHRPRDRRCEGVPCEARDEAPRPRQERDKCEEERGAHRDRL